MNSEDIFRNLKREVENTAAEAQRAKGALDQLTSQLENDYGCKTLKEAEALLAKLESQKDRSQEAFERQLKAYQKKWKENEE